MPMILGVKYPKTFIFWFYRDFNGNKKEGGSEILLRPWFDIYEPLHGLSPFCCVFEIYFFVDKSCYFILDF